MKMYCVMAEEAIVSSGGNRGKMAAQAGHAFLHSYWDCQDRFPELANSYREGGAAKIVLKAPLQTIIELKKLYNSITGVSLVIDAGRTVFSDPTPTCIGIGPLYSDDREEILKGLKVWI